MFYAFTIVICMAIISVINIFTTAKIYDYAFWEIIVWTTVSTISVIIIDGIFATVARRLLPAKWFTIEKKGYCASKKECKFYEKIGIKKWKDKVLELGMFTNFRKNKIADPSNNEYVAQYIIESNYGVICHLLGVIFGVGATFCCPMNLWLTVGLPVVLVNIVLSTLPIFILRYNLPKLHTLYKLNERKVKRAKENQTEVA